MKTVELETAKLAKEKGYDNFFSKTLCGELIQAYQYDIMEWLREEHNIYISIIPSVTMAPKSKVSFTYQIRGDSNGEQFKISYSSIAFYSNYEECLETALREALKLIK